MIEKNHTLSIDKEWTDQESYVYYLFEITCLATRCHPFFKHKVYFIKLTIEVTLHLG